MVKTIAMERLTENVESVYEAIIAISRRARQINDERRAERERFYYQDANDDFLDDDFDMDEPVKYEESPIKPPTQALTEFISADVELKYKKEDDAA
jgi:DNA-directed RNA polymerase subunit K/omega